jgi:hypothetical protein
MLVPLLQLLVHLSVEGDQDLVGSPLLPPLRNDVAVVATTTLKYL